MPRKTKIPTETDAVVAGFEGTAPTLAKASKTRTKTVVAAKPAIARKRTAKAAVRVPAPAESNNAPATTDDQIQHAGVSEQEQVALLAYRFWVERGCQGGSPEADWFRAEQEIRTRRSQPERTQ